MMVEKGGVGLKRAIGMEVKKTRDKIGGTIHTDLFKHEDGTYTAYSFYWQDEEEECVAEAMGEDPIKVVTQSRRNLRKDWMEWKESIKEIASIE
jgi:hypothetical protein